jgi:hypothetical protein
MKLGNLSVAATKELTPSPTQLDRDAHLTYFQFRALNGWFLIPSRVPTKAGPVF